MGTKLYREETNMSIFSKYVIQQRMKALLNLSHYLESDNAKAFI